MRYFKDTKNEVYGIDIGQESLIRPEWKEISKAKATAPLPLTPEQVKQSRINQLKTLLAQTDYKVLPDYDKPNDDIKVQRQAWRDEIRSLGG